MVLALIPWELMPALKCSDLSSSSELSDFVQNSVPLLKIGKAKVKDGETFVSIKYHEVFEIIIKS